MPKTKALKAVDGTKELEEATKKRNGRPSALNQEVQDKIVESLSKGNYLETASAFAGVSKQTLYDWMKRGNRELASIKKGNKPNKRETKFVNFLDAVAKAKADHEQRCIDRLEAAATSGEYRVDQWMLERKYPNKWGNKVSVAAKQGEHKDADESLNESIAEALEQIEGNRFDDD